MPVMFDPAEQATPSPDTTQPLPAVPPASADAADGSEAGRGAPARSAAGAADGGDPSALDKVIKTVDNDPVAKGGRVKRLTYVTMILAGVMAIVCAIGGVIAVLYGKSLNNRIDRVDAFQGVPEQERPAKPKGQAMNILLLGSDLRDDPTWQDDSGSRTDTIILAHITAEKDSVQLISIPRDTWLPIPKTADGKKGGKDAKINAAYAFGDVPLMVQTVEQFTQVRIDHVVLINFAGFKEIIDALDGVDIMVDQDFTSYHPPYRKFTQGMYHMNGVTALDYARQRKQFADGDFTRINHQQQLIKAVVQQAASAGLLSDPGRLDAFLKATADSITADKDLNVLSFALEMRQLRGSDMTFLTSPSAGTGTAGGQSVVFADKQRAALLYAAVKEDRVLTWLAANPDYAH